MQKKTLLLCFFVLLKFILQYQLTDPVYELHRDEFLHLDQGKHLAWGYLSVPPFTSWISFIILKLGNTIFWIKFFPALFGALTLVIVWKAIEALKGNWFALILGTICILFSALLRINLLYQPNSFDILCWVFLYYCLLQYINTQHKKWIWIAAITFALGFLNKYNIAFLIIGLVPALLLSRHRNIFANRSLYIAMLVALVLIFPNLLWQYQHGFPVIGHLKELSDTQLVNVNRADFLKEQLLFFVGSLFVIIAAFIAFFTYPPFYKYRVFFISLVIILFLFTYLKAKAYYAIGLYPIFIAFGSVYMENILQKGWRRVLQPFAIFIPLLLFIPLLQIAFPLKSPAEIFDHPEKFQQFGLLRWEDGKDHALPQDFADMLGWKELARIVDSTYNIITDKEHTLIRCDNYGQAGAINYYSKNKNINALSYNADYIFWFPKKIEWTNLIMITDDYHRDKERKKEKPYFDSIYLAGKISNKFAREYETAVFVLLGAKPSVNAILRKEIEEKKDHK